MNAVTKPGQFFEHYDPLFGPEHPELGSGPLSTEPYVSAEYFERERERIFAKSWFHVGHESEVPNPGDYVVVDLPVLKTSVILVRGNDGVVRGFHNVCPHRGNQLEHACAAGSKRVFVCQFHSWSFDTQGKLRGVPERDRFTDLDESTRGLRPVSVESFKGLLFLNAQEKPEAGLRDYMGEVAKRLESYPFERMRMAAAWKVDLKANWKVVVDAFQEGYHVATVHKNVAPSMYKAARSGHSRMTGFKTHGFHRTMSVPKNPDFVPSPVEGMAFQMYMPSLMQGTNPAAGEFLWPGLNPNRDPLPTWAFDVNVVFPSTYIDVSQGFYWTYEFHPRSVGETRFESKIYIAETQTWSQRIGQEFLLIQLREALMEDLAVLESVQRGLDSGALKDIVLSDQELAIRHHYKSVESLVRD